MVKKGPGYVQTLETYATIFRKFEFFWCQTNLWKTYPYEFYEYLFRFYIGSWDRLISGIFVHIG